MGRLLPVLLRAKTSRLARLAATECGYRVASPPPQEVPVYVGIPTLLVILILILLLT